MDGWKAWYTSKTAVASALGAVVSLLGIAGVVWKVDVGELANDIVILAPLGILVVTSVLSLYGRITATKRIGPPPAPRPPWRGLA